MPTVSSADSPGVDHRWSWPRFTRNAALAAGLIALLAWFIVDGVVPNLVPKNFGVVQEGVLYRSGELTPRAMRTVIEKHSIKAIIDFGAHDHDPAGERREQAVAESLGVERYVLLMRGDGTGDPNNYAEALRIMTDPDRQPVLVHCAAGAQRTGCAVALYRSIVQGWDDDRALNETRQYRHDPAKNPHLEEMYRTWRDEIARALRSGGEIDTTEQSGEDG